MWKVLSRSPKTSESVAPPYMAESADVSGSSSMAEPVTVTQIFPEMVHRPTFGISLSELKAAIAPRARYMDETDRSQD